MEVTLDLGELDVLVEEAVTRALSTERTAGWLDARAAGEYLSLSAESIRSMRKRGDGPEATVLPNGRVRYSTAALDAWARGEA